MNDVRKLADLKKGEKAVIRDLVSFHDMRRRLQDIGLIEGTVVECVGKSPLGDPAAYLIRGAVIALRSEDSGSVLLYPEEMTRCAQISTETAHRGKERGILAEKERFREEQIWD